MFDHELSAQQLAVICALSSGAAMTAAAEEAAVHRNTINNWLRNLIPVQQALAGAQFHDGVGLKAALDIIQAAANPHRKIAQIYTIRY